MTIALFLLIAALVLFIVSALGVGSRINLQSAGLACLVASMIFGAGVL